MELIDDFSLDHVKKKLLIIEINPDLSHLSANQMKIIEILIECSKILDEIFYLQKHAENLKIRNELEKLDNKKLVDFFKIMSGPFDQFNDNKPYIKGIEKNDKAGFYPEDLSRDEWETFLRNNSEKKDEFISPYSVIVREKEGLKAVSYSEYYKDYLEPASNLLHGSLEFADELTLKSYLHALSNAFISNDFFEADIRWLQLDNDIESLLGPHEFYDDRFLGYKASFTSFIAVRNRDETNKLKMILKLLDMLQEKLPIPEHYKSKKRGSISQLKVVDLIYAAGDARGPFQTAAFNLPNSQKIRSIFGSKKILIYNIMKAKFDSIMNILAEKLLPENSRSKVTFSAYFNFILLHEISHELGIGYIKDAEGNLYEVSYFLKDLFTIIEEAKADIMGIYSILILMKDCYITDCTFVELVTTYLISILRSIRFGRENAHGVANIIQWNFLIKEQVIMAENGNLSIDFHKFENAVESILTRILTLQGEGDYDKLKKFIGDYSQVDEVLGGYLNRINDLPVDIFPWFPIAGENMPEL